MNSKKEKNEFCSVCKSIAKQKCSDCKIVYYCSREHQKEDWKRHSKDCRAYELVEDSKIGRRYVSTRQIEADEIVMIENKPLLILPDFGTEPVCLNCYIALTVNDAKPCNNCGWPLCVNCTKHGPECELTMKYRKSKVNITRYSMSDPSYDGVTILRALDLRDKNPRAYRKLLKLEDHSDRMIRAYVDGLLSWSVIHVACFLKAFMKIDDLDEKEIGKIIGIVAVNGFGHSTPEGRDITAVFDKSSYIEHNCRPNCRNNTSYDVNKVSRMIIQAAMTIPKGHPISIGYVLPFRDTVLRRNILRRSKFFDCECERCSDPTEFGTMFSAVKCFEKKCTGYMLPPTFLVSHGKEIPDFVCDKCSLTTPSKTIEKMIKDVSMKYSKINQRDVNQLKKFIHDQSNFLHENHFHIFKAQQDFDVAFMNMHLSLHSVSDKTLKEHITLCKKVIYLLETLGPSSYIFRGEMLHSEYRCWSMLADRQFFRNEPEYRRLIGVSKKVIAECYRMMRYEPPGTVEAQIAEFARLELETMDTLQVFETED